MENKKSNRNSIIILLITIIVVLATSLVLLSTGTISFNGEGNKTEEKPQPIETNDTDIFTKLVGTYSYKGKYVDSKEEIPENITFEETVYNELILNSSGEAEAKAGSVRGSGSTAKGKWYISNDKIIILNEKCTPSILNGEVEYVNCQPTWTYTYKIEDNKVIISSNSNLTKGETLVKE